MKQPPFYTQEQHIRQSSPFSLLPFEERTSFAPTAGCRPWSVVSSPNLGSGSNALFGVVAVSAQDIWAVGYSTDTSANNSPSHTLIEHWDGQTWQVIQSPNSQESFNMLFGVAVVNASDIWAVGESSNSPFSRLSHTLIEHWDGTAWHVVSSPNTETDGNALLQIAVVNANDIWAVGESFDSTTSHPLIEHWDGTAWHVVPSPNVGLVGFLSGLAVVSAKDIWAVGRSAETATSHIHTLIEHWDGQTWQVIQSPNLEPGMNALKGVTVVSASDVWAVGFSSSERNSIFTRALIMHWNGKVWRIVRSPNPGWSSNVLLGVTAISARNIWAVGLYGNTAPTGPETSQTLVEQWNGKIWTAIPSQSPGLMNNALNAVTRVPGTSQLWAVGNSQTSNDIFQNLIEFSC